MFEHKLYQTIKQLLFIYFITLIFDYSTITTSANTPYSLDQTKILSDINALRSEMGLSPVQLDPTLSNAAIDHSIYLFANNQIGHTQTSTLYKTHTSFYERIKQYASSEYISKNKWHMLGENVAYRSPVYAVRDLIEAPYHRLPILHPHLSHIGVGTIGYHNTVVTFGIGKTSNYSQFPILYPYHNEENVLLSQKVFENPDPFQDLELSQLDAGFVLSIFTGTDVTIDDLNISLVDEKKNEISFIVKTLNSDYSNFWLVIPKERLSPLTTYTFKVNQSSSKFTTMSLESFNNWDINREPNYIPYQSNKDYFNDMINKLKEVNNTSHLPISEFDNLDAKYTIEEAQINYNKEKISLYFNNQYVNVSPPIKLVENRVYVPLRTLSELLGSQIHYNNFNGEIKIITNGVIVTLLNDNTTIHVSNHNDQFKTKLHHPRFKENNYTFVPLRALSEIFDIKISWDSKTYTIHLYK